MIPQRFLSADEVKAQIQRLLTECPELREDDEALVLSLESETEATELCDRLVKKIGETKAFSDATAKYISELRSRQETLDLRLDRLRETLVSIMMAADVKKLPLSIATLFITHKQHVIVTEMSLIPSQYLRYRPAEPSKIDIAAAIKAGKTVPGCEMSNPEPSLTIRVK